MPCCLLFTVIKMLTKSQFVIASIIVFFFYLYICEPFCTLAIFIIESLLNGFLLEWINKLVNNFVTDWSSSTCCRSNCVLVEKKMTHSRLLYSCPYRLSNKPRYFIAWLPPKTQKNKNVYCLRQTSMHLLWSLWWVGEGNRKRNRKVRDS